MIPIDALKKRFGAEAAFIVLILRVYFRKTSKEAVLVFVQKNPIDWKHLNVLIYSYEIRPIVYKVLSAYPEILDQQFLAELKNDCLLIVASNFEKLRELIRLQKIFQAHHLKVVPFKGVFLSQLLFDDYTTRETCDIDFLFEPKDSVEITRIMFSEKYQTTFYFDETQEDFIKKISGERLFTKSDSFASSVVELHWLINPTSFDVPLSATFLLKNTTSQKLFGEDVELLNTKNALITLLTHHGVTDVWRNLKHVVDIAAFMDKHADKIEWPAFELELKKLRLEKTSKIGLVLAHELLGAELPPLHFRNNDSIIKKVLHSLLSYPMLNKFKYSPQHFFRHVTLRDSATDKTRFLLKCFRLLFLPTANDLKWINLPRRWFFIYYVLKPFRLLKDRVSP